MKKTSALASAAAAAKKGNAMSMQKIAPEMTVEEAKKILEAEEYVPEEIVEIPVSADELFAKTSMAVNDPERDVSGIKYLQAAVLMRASIETLEQRLVNAGCDRSDGPEMWFCPKEPFEVKVGRYRYFETFDAARDSTEREVVRHLKMAHCRVQFEEFRSRVTELGGWMNFENTAVEVCLPRSKFNENQKYFRTTDYSYSVLGLASFILDLKKEEAEVQEAVLSNEKELERMRVEKVRRQKVKERAEVELGIRSSAGDGAEVETEPLDDSEAREGWLEEQK